MTLTNRTLAVIIGELRDALKHEVADIIAVGELLVEAKGKMKHGEWLPWLKKEFSMSERTARNYMKAAEFAAKSATVADLQQLSPRALYLLAQADWGEGYCRTEATAAVLKEAAEKRVGYDRAKEIIDEILDEMKKTKARDEAIASAMWADLEKAKLEAGEAGKPWDEDHYRNNWIAEHWSDEKEADFEAKWKKTRPQGPGIADEAQAPSLQPTSDVVGETAGTGAAPVDANGTMPGEDIDLPKPASPAKNAPAKAKPISEFNNHVLRLLEMTKGAKPRGFIKTQIEPDELDGLGKFLSDIAKLKSNALGTAHLSPHDTAEQRKRENAARELSGTSIEASDSQLKGAS